jgi:hypothetical protein
VPVLLVAISIGHLDVAITLLACGEQLEINAQTY